MKHLIVFNPSAGSNGADEAFRALIKEKFAGLDYEVYETTGPRSVIPFLKDYLPKQKDTVRVYACGGDGTVHEVANGLVGQKNAELAIYPAGTGNDFVKTYGVTNEEIEKYRNFDALIKGQPVEIDLSKLSGGNLKEPLYSINVINFGFDAIVGARGNYYKENGFPKKVKEGTNPYDYALKNDAMKYGRFNDIEVSRSVGKNLQMIIFQIKVFPQCRFGLLPQFLDFLQRQFPGGHDAACSLRMPEITGRIIRIIGLGADVPLNLRTDFFRDLKHARVCNNQCIRLQFPKLLKISTHALQIRIMRKNISSHMDPHTTRMRIRDAGGHFFHIKILRLRPQAKFIAADINSICAEIHGDLENFQTAGRHQQFRFLPLSHLSIPFSLKNQQFHKQAVRGSPVLAEQGLPVKLMYRCEFELARACLR